jgi:hypothetical protein
VFSKWKKKAHDWFHRIGLICDWNDGTILLYNADSFSYRGLFWGWKHRYQTCDLCKRDRLIEGFLPQAGYYLRSGFEPEME